MKTRVVVLAAGKGKRMGAEVPKVLIPFNGKPLVQHLLETIKKSGVDDRPVVVIGKDGDLIKKTLGEEYDYVIQEEQLGTGHAVLSTEPLLSPSAESVIVLYGDHPFLQPETIKKLHDLHEAKGGPLAMMTTCVDDFEDWRSLFKDFGRVKRNQEGDIQSVVETKDATPEEREIKEVNPSFFSFEATWLWEHLKQLKNNNAQSEYYLTDLVKIAIQEGHPIVSVQASPIESIGVNTPEQLEVARNLH